MLLGQPLKWPPYGIDNAVPAVIGLDSSSWPFDRFGVYQLQPYSLPPILQFVPPPIPPMAFTNSIPPNSAYSGRSESGGAMRDHTNNLGRARGFGGFGGDFVTLPDWARAGLNVATAAPFPIGAAASLAGAGMRINNLAATNRMRSVLGLPELSLGQILGGVLGLNDYGSVNSNALRGEINLGYGPTAVTVGGLYNRGGWFDPDIRAAFTPMEAIRRLNAQTPAYRGHWGPRGAAPSGIGHDWGGGWGRSGGEGYGGPGGRGGLSADPTAGKAGR